MKCFVCGVDLNECGRDCGCSGATMITRNATYVRYWCGKCLGIALDAAFAEAKAQTGDIRGHEMFQSCEIAKNVADLTVRSDSPYTEMDGGYQPRSQSGVKPADLKRPRGGSAVERPNSREIPTVSIDSQTGSVRIRENDNSTADWQQFELTASEAELIAPMSIVAGRLE